MDWFLKPCNAIMFLYGHTTRGMVTISMEDDLRKQRRSHISHTIGHKRIQIFVYQVDRITSTHRICIQRYSEVSSLG